MKNRCIQLFAWIRNIILSLIVLSLLSGLLYKYIPVYYTSSRFFYSLEQLKAKKPAKTQHQWVSLENISSHIIRAVIASEDNLFFGHNGFDFAPSNEIRTDFLTISQQTAGLIFLWPDDSWFRNLMETYYTILIEFIWGKERIMEVYLNSVEIAEGIFGVEAASRAFFEKPAAELNEDEAALIAVVIPFSRSSDLKNPSSYILKKQAKIKTLMQKTRPIEFGKQQLPPTDEE